MVTPLTDLSCLPLPTVALPNALGLFRILWMRAVLFNSEVFVLGKRSLVVKPLISHLPSFGLNPAHD